MIARNMNELHSMLHKELRKAMEKTLREVMKDMQDSIQYFYDGGFPDKYHRTEAMKDTPSTTDIKEQGNVISFEAFLNTQHQYTTGKNPNMLQVLLLTNDLMTKQPDIGKLRKAVGSPYYWQLALDKMEKTYNDVLSNFFTEVKRK